MSIVSGTGLRSKFAPRAGAGPGAGAGAGAQGRARGRDRGSGPGPGPGPRGRGPGPGARDRPPSQYFFCSPIAYTQFRRAGAGLGPGAGARGRGPGAGGRDPGAGVMREIEDHFAYWSFCLGKLMFVNKNLCFPLGNLCFNEKHKFP